MNPTEAAIQACNAAIKQNPEAAGQLFPFLSKPQAGFMAGDCEFYFSALGIINASLDLAGLERVAISFDEDGKPIGACRYKQPKAGTE